MLAAKRTGVRATAFVLAAGVSVTACGTRDAHHPGPEAGGATKDVPCRQFESFSGRLLVGNPLLARPSAALVPVQPGEVPPPVPALPTLDSIEMDRTASGDTIVFRLSGDGAIGWTARFVQMPLLQGAGGAVFISGSCILQIDLTGVDSGAAWGSDELPIRLSPDGDASAVVEILGYPSSNGLAQTFVGIRSGTPAVAVDASTDRPAILVAIAS